jgi:hypothetical protein
MQPLLYRFVIVGLGATLFVTGTILMVCGFGGMQNMKKFNKGFEPGTAILTDTECVGCSDSRCTCVSKYVLRESPTASFSWTWVGGRRCGSCNKIVVEPPSVLYDAGGSVKEGHLYRPDRIHGSLVIGCVGVVVFSISVLVTAFLPATYSWHRESRVDVELKTLPPAQLRAATSSGGTECAICTEEMVEGGLCECTICGNLFHEHCMREWALARTTCPLCRGTIPRETV